MIHVIFCINVFIIERNAQAGEKCVGKLFFDYRNFVFLFQSSQKSKKLYFELKTLKRTEIVHNLGKKGCL